MRLTVLIVILACNIGAISQEVTGQMQQVDVRVLLERINRLENRVAELEAKNARESASVQKVVASNTRMEQESVPAVPVTAYQRSAAHDQKLGVQAQVEETEIFPSLKIRGFADVDFASSDQPGVTSGFSVGQFVLHFVSRLSKKVSYFGEVSLTAQPNLYNVDLERSFIRYDINDTAKISFGRYHTPINYWNTAFHHGAWLQTTISRPDMIRFGGSFEPVHFVGAQSEGNIPSGGLNLGYNVGIGNGRGSIFSRAGDTGDVNNNRAWLVNVFARPGAVRHLQVGSSFYRDKLSAAGTSVGPEGVKFGEWIAAGHLVWTGEAPEFLAEFAHVRHQSDLTGHTFDSQGGYAQIAYRIPAGEKRWKPYLRYDYIQVPTGEPVFFTISNVRGFTLGTRYDISDFAALKGEYRNGRSVIGSADRVNSLVMQTAFTF
jgi:hypothetical protein